MGKRAFLSVWDKTGIVEFAKGLHELGFEILSTGGNGAGAEGGGNTGDERIGYHGFPRVLRRQGKDTPS